jgi:hypothetical protein
MGIDEKTLGLEMNELDITGVRKFFGGQCSPYDNYKKSASLRNWNDGMLE